MKILDYVVCILLSVCFTLLFLYPRISENKAAWNAQAQINENVIETIKNLNEIDQAIIDHLTTKKPGQ